MAIANFEKIIARNTLDNIPDGYQHLTWEAMFAADKGAFNARPNGYYGVLHDRTVAATTGNDSVILDPNGTFTFASGYFAAAWRTGLKVTFTAKLNNVTVGVVHATLDESAHFIKFPHSFHNIDEVEITTKGGHAVNPDIANGPNVAMDSLTLDHFVTGGAHAHAHAPEVAACLLPSLHESVAAWNHVPLM